MNHILFLFLFVVVGQLANAQNAGVTGRLNKQQSIPAVITLVSGAFRSSGDQPSFAVNGFEDCELVLKSQYKSLLGNHYLYQQVYKGIPVYGSYVKVNTNVNGDVLSSFHTLVKISDYEVPALPSSKIDYWVVGSTELFPSVNEQKDHYLVLKHADGTLLYSKDQRLYYTDTMVKAMVFNPDPLTTAGVVYGQGGSYRNFHDSDYALLNDQRMLKSFPARFDNDTFRLANKYSIITEFEEPVLVPSTSLTDEFFFTRSQYGFKEVMAMYHVYATQLYIQSLGFNEVNYQLKIDPHATDGDNSYFSYDNGDTTLRFGLGGVPDAEDADVIVHEYTHAISFSLNPDGIVSLERRAIEEGLCDAMCCAYSKRQSMFNWRNIFGWDGHNEFWDGRNGSSAKTYENKIDSYYSDSEIWSSAMNNLTEAMGEDALIRLMLSVIPQFNPNTTMPQAARFMYDADSILNNKVHQGILALEFNARKFGTFPVGLNDITFDKNFSITNTLAFAQGTGNATIALKQSGEFGVKVCDINGKILNERNDTGELVLKTDEYKPGIYFVQVSYKDLNGYYKLVKY